MTIRYGHVTAAGKSIREIIWSKLDDAVDQLMSPEEAYTECAVCSEVTHSRCTCSC